MNPAKAFIEESKSKSSSEETLDLDPRLRELLLDEGLDLTADAAFVRWAPENPRHPRNWPTARKVYDLTVIHLLDLFVTATSSAGTAAANAAHTEFNIDPTLAIFLFVSVSLFGQVIGSLVLGSYSEAFGRKRLYVVSTALFSTGCVVVSVTNSLAAVVIGRISTGFLSSVAANVLTGSLEDMYPSQQRLWWMCNVAVASNLGLILGPVISIYITTELGWRWVFYIMAIITAALTLLTLLLRESRPTLLLANEVAHFQRKTGLTTPPALNPDHTPDIRTFARTTLIRPVQLYGEPIVCCVAMLVSTTFGLIYLFSESLLPIYQSLGLSYRESSLSFVAIGVGVLLSLPTRWIDTWIVRRKQRAGKPLLPEHKLAGLCIAVPVLAIGLWWFAWTIPPGVEKMHWIVPTLPLVLIGYAINEFLTVMLGYLADSYLSYACSGLAAVACLRGVCSACFPLFAGQMFGALGNNVAVSILAALATVYCVVPPVFVRYGPRIRASSRFARYSLRTHAANCVDKDELVGAA